MQEFADWLAGTAMSLTIQQALWLIPLLQTIHILAIAMVISSVAMVDLRILGIARSQTMAQTAHRFVPWLWSGLVLLALTGAILIIGEPKRSLPNPAFQIKMLLLALAIVVTLAFQASLRRNSSIWDDASRRTATSVLALSAFALWCAIAVAGRWIAYIKIT
jgi:hypothetical protein